MQNRYVADEGDFAKFGLLRALAGVYPLDESPSSLGVVWYRPDIETGSPGDGSKRNHLNDPQQRYRRCDPELFDSLKSISATNRSVNAIKESGILGGQPGLLLQQRDPDAPARTGAAANAKTRERSGGVRRWSASGAGRSCSWTPTTVSPRTRSRSDTSAR